MEHQSKVDALMPLRLLTYMVRIWSRHVRAARAAARAAAKKRKGKRKKARPEPPRLPPIVPLVLSHAPSGWTAARSFGELLEGPEALLRAVRPMTPDFAPVLEDLTERTEEELRRLRADSLTRLEFR